MLSSGSKVFCEDGYPFHLMRYSGFPARMGFRTMCSAANISKSPLSGGPRWSVETDWSRSGGGEVGGKVGGKVRSSTELSVGLESTLKLSAGKSTSNK